MLLLLFSVHVPIMLLLHRVKGVLLLVLLGWVKDPSETHTITTSYSPTSAQRRSRRRHGIHFELLERLSDLHLLVSKRKMAGVNRVHIRSAAHRRVDGHGIELHASDQREVVQVLTMERTIRRREILLLLLLLLLSVVR